MGKALGVFGGIGLMLTILYGALYFYHNFVPGYAQSPWEMNITIVLCAIVGIIMILFGIASALDN